MAVVCKKLHGMKFNDPKILFATTALFFLIATTRENAQTNSFSGLKDYRATDFTQETYFEPPDDQKIKMRLSGASAAPLPGTMQDVKELKLELFNTNGNSTVTVKAPQCTYAPLDGVASSAGHLEVTTSGGKFRTEGDGFLWRQSEQSLSISNHVVTTIATELFAEQKNSL
jgi:hypothetical protein